MSSTSIPKEGAEQKAPAGAAPASVATVKASAAGSNQKPPSIVALEKKVSFLEDDLTKLKGWRDDINTFLAKVGIGSDQTPPAKSQSAAIAAPAPGKGVLEAINDELFGD